MHPVLGEPTLINEGFMRNVVVIDIAICFFHPLYKHWG